jgi:hypothetical protein
VTLILDNGVNKGFRILSEVGSILRAIINPYRESTYDSFTFKLKKEVFIKLPVKMSDKESAGWMS